MEVAQASEAYPERWKGRYRCCLLPQEPGAGRRPELNREALVPARRRPGLAAHWSGLQAARVAVGKGRRS